RSARVSHPAEGLVSVHRLVQSVTANQLPEDLAGQWRRAAPAMIGAALPGDPGRPGDWPVYALLLPHAQGTFSAGSDKMERIGSYLRNSGRLLAAPDPFPGGAERR